MNMHVSPTNLQTVINTEKGKTKVAKQQTVTKLYAAFLAAHEAMQAMPSPKPGEVETPLWDKAVAQCTQIAWKIVKAPARTLEEIFLKIKVAGWSAGVMRPNYRLTDLDNWQPTEFTNTEEMYALV